MAQPGIGLRDADEVLTMRGEHRELQRPRAAPLLAGQRRDGRADLPQRRGRRRASTSTRAGLSTPPATTPTSAWARACCFARPDHRPPVPRGEQPDPGPAAGWGPILVELEAIEPDELMPPSRHQVKDILIDLLTWTHGDYEFVIKELDPRTLRDAQHLHGERHPGGHPAHPVLEPGAQRHRGHRVVPVPPGTPRRSTSWSSPRRSRRSSPTSTGAPPSSRSARSRYLSNFETCRILWALQVLGAVRRGQAGDAVRGGRGAGAGAGPRGDRREVQPDVRPHLRLPPRAHRGRRRRLHGRRRSRKSRGSTARSSQGVDLRHYGRADFEQMLANVADFPPEQRSS